MEHKKIEETLYNKFLEILSKHNNPQWALDELDYLVFVKYYYEFISFSDEEQWVIRNYMNSLRKIYK